MRLVMSLALTILAASVLGCDAKPPPATTEAEAQATQTNTAAVPATNPGQTQVVFLGTGTPLPDPDRAGPSTAVVVNGSAYLFDTGAGVVRRAMAAARNGIPALNSVNLKTAFLTHLHWPPPR